MYRAGSAVRGPAGAFSVLASGGGYLVAVKENQPNLLRVIKQQFAGQIAALPFIDLQTGLPGHPGKVRREITTATARDGRLAIITPKGGG